jgi:hypothetical protein
LLRARIFFADLLLADAKALVEQSEFPFHLEARTLRTPAELLQEWTQNLFQKRLDLLTLYGIEILSPQEMEKKYGKPPRRLASLPWRSPGTYVAVANLSGHAAIAIFHKGPRGWKVAAFHD